MDAITRQLQKLRDAAPKERETCKAVAIDMLSISHESMAGLICEMWCDIAALQHEVSQLQQRLDAEASRTRDYDIRAAD